MPRTSPPPRGGSLGANDWLRYAVRPLGVTASETASRIVSGVSAGRSASWPVSRTGIIAVRPSSESRTPGTGLPSTTNGWPAGLGPEVRVSAWARAVVRA